MDPAAKVPPAYRSTAEYAWRFIVIVAAVVVVGYVLLALRLVVIPVALASLITALLSPVAGWLRRKGVPAGLAAGAAFLLALAFVGLLGWFIAAQIANDFAELRRTAEQGFNDALDWLHDGPLALDQEQVDKARDSVTQAASENREALTTGAVTAATVAAEVVTGTLLMLFTTFFLLYDGERIWGWVVRLFPKHVEARADVAGRAAWATLRGYTHGTVLVALFDAVLIGSGLWILQVPLAAPLAALVFLGAFIPLVGAVVAGVFAVLVALADGGFVTALIALGIVLAVQQVEGHVLQPFLLGRFVSIHPLAIVLAVAGGAIAAGIIGALLAVPLVAVVNTVTLTLVRGPVAAEASSTVPDGGIRPHG